MPSPPHHYGLRSLQCALCITNSQLTLARGTRRKLLCALGLRAIKSEASQPMLDIVESGGRLGPVAYTDLPEDSLKVILDCERADPEHCTDLGFALSTSNEFENFLFPAA